MEEQSRFPEEQIKAVRDVLASASSALQTAYERISGGCIHMPLSDRRILVMAAADSSIILREIREKLGIPNSTLTSAIDRLETRGLLRRVVSERDRRSFGLELTYGGRAYVALQQEAEVKFAIHVLEILGTDADRLNFIETLTKVVSKLG